MSRDGTAAVVERIERAAGRLASMRVMEVCGTHTVSIFRAGLRSILPEPVKLISGPGCPVCVTTQGYVDAACALASRSGVTIATYGDMVRVPGRGGSLEARRAEGADVRVVYSARDALKAAREDADRQVVFLAVGFETTAPATAAVLMEAKRGGVENFTVLPGHKLVVPALDALLSAGGAAIDAFLLPGHVSVIIGLGAYRPVLEQYRMPAVVAGFEPASVLRALAEIAEMLERGEPGLGNAYGMAVKEEGNAVALGWLREVFEPSEAEWRALGRIGESGLELRGDYKRFDARERFGVEFGPDYEAAGCRCGEVIQGRAEPGECMLFGRACTVRSPVGPCMVSSEGACAAWYKYGRR